MKKLSVALTTLLLATSAYAEGALKSLTIYGNSEQVINTPYYNYRQNAQGSGYAFATYMYEVNYTKGENKIIINNLPEKVEQSSISLGKLGQGKSLIEQYFLNKAQASLDSADEIKGEVTVQQVVGEKLVEYKGEIINSSQLVDLGEAAIALLQADGKILIVNNPATISLPKLDGFEGGALANNNSQTWVINSTTEGKDSIEYNYKTSGISWATEYVLTISDDKQQTTGNLQAFANIFNYSGVSYLNANLKLVAGQVNSQPEARPMMLAKAAMVADMAAPSPAEEVAPSNFTTNNFSDLQTYTIERKVDLPNQILKKIKLFEDRSNVKIAREYLIDSNNGGNEVNVQFKLLNKKEDGLGQATLPAGKFKVFEADKAGNNEFIGEVVISQATVGDKITVSTNKAVNLKSERKVISQNDDQTKRAGSMEIEYELSNQKSSDVVITINENLYQNNWKISENNFEFTKETANIAKFSVPVKAGKTETLKFKVDYSF